jgi:hypothetical protein
VPKVYPPKTIDELRNISGLLNLDKIAEKLISKMMIKDMKSKMDPSQYANQNGLSIRVALIWKHCHFHRDRAVMRVLQEQVVQPVYTSILHLRAHQPVRKLSIRTNHG